MKKIITVLSLALSFTASAQFTYLDKSYGKSISETATAVGKDSEGNSFTLVFYCSFDGPDAPRGTALQKKNAKGNLLWTKNISSLSGENDRTAYGTAMSFDDAGSVYVIGYYSGTVLIDTIRLHSKTKSMFIVKYNKKGVLQWVEYTDSSIGNEIKNEGEFFYITGTTVEMENKKECNRVFIAKYDTSGFQSWNKTNESDGFSTGNTIQIANQSIYLLGLFKDTLTFNTFHLTCRDSDYGDRFLLKLDLHGNILTGYFVANGYLSFNKIRVDENDYVIFIWEKTDGSKLMKKFDANGKYIGQELAIQ